MNTINTPTTNTPQGFREEEETGLTNSGQDARWEETNTSGGLDRDVDGIQDGYTSHDTTTETRAEDWSSNDQFADGGVAATNTTDGSPFNQTPNDGVAAPMAAPVARDHDQAYTTDGNPVTSNSDEVLRIVHNEGEDKPWEIQYGDGINMFQKARAILNYPVHKFETEAKAQEVAEMLRGIIDADAVEQDGRVISREGVSDQGGEFFHSVSEKGEAPPGMERERVGHVT